MESPESKHKSHKKSKKSKKEKKSKKDKSHKKKSRSSVSSGSDSEGASVWVEKAPEHSKSVEPATNPSSSNQREEWMTTPSLFACITRDQIRAAKQPSEKKKEHEEAKFMLDRPGQTGRELNPYWANGGSGLPSEKPVEPESLALASTTVGDQGAGWLRRALKRAREQAEESGRSLEEVAAERWGSLEKLEALLSEAEGRKVSLRDERFKAYDRVKINKQEYNRRNDTQPSSQRSEKNERYSKDSFRGRERHGDSSRDQEKKRYQSDKHDHVDKTTSCRDRDDIGVSHSHKCSSSELNLGYQRSYNKSSYNRDEKPRTSDHRSYGVHFKKPDPDLSGSCEEGPRARDQGPSNSKNWRKKDFTVRSGEKDKSPERKLVEKLRNRVEKKSGSEDSDSNSEPPEISKSKQDEILTDQQMNELAAKLVKAEILGNDELVSQLKKKLETARHNRAANPAAVPMKAKKEEDVVILSRTDSKGFSRPLQTASAHPEPVGGRRKKQKSETHGADGQRLRYFPDDDKYSLQDMFQKEKLTTVEDNNEMFTKLAGKSARQEHDLDMDDIFAERAQEKEADGKVEARERERAIGEHRRQQKMLDSCRWCFESRHLQHHLVVAVGIKSYVCLPPYQSLTEGHCLIIPLHHTVCATQLDEDVWEEIQDFRKALVKMFAAEDEDCVFFESAMYLKKFPHMVLHCVPLPRESGDMAPIYFKKAILESESEWSTNKKLVDLSEKNVRRSVPKGLPYFSVDFGMQGGFAHVIEDENLFPKNFAEEIIGGMLDLDHGIWRKPRYENFDKQRKKSVDFSKRWKEYDFTKKLKDKRKRTSSDSSTSSN